MFIKCGCLHCGQNIEFATDDFQEDHRTEAAVFGQFVSCPACSNETRLFISQTPNATATISRQGRFWKVVAVISFVIISVAACLVLGWILKKYGNQIVEAVGGGIGALVVIGAGVFVAVLALFWLFFPVVMYFQLKRSNELLAMVERNTRQFAEKK